MSIPTVRVTNPAFPNQFKVINASDYRELVHGSLWPEQAPDFMGLPPAPVASFAQNERDFAGALMLEVMEFRAKTEGKQFAALSPEYRMVALRDARNEFEDSRLRYDRSHQVSERELKETIEAVPGQTPGHPVHESELQYSDLANSTRERLAEITLGENDGTSELGQSVLTNDSRPDLLDPETGSEPPPPLPPLGSEEGGTAPTAPETPPNPAVPSWASKKAPDTSAMRVDKGPGSKFYVLKGTDVLSEGFTTKTKAEDEMRRLTEAST